MSGQRYHPQDQRYAPSDDSRFPPRDRSPPRYGGDRFPSSSSYRPGYQNRSDDPRDSNSSPLSRDPPRGPKAPFDTPRGAAPFPPSAPRGRGFSGRGEYRGIRGADAGRDSHDLASPWSDDRDRSWRDRELERRDRRPSSPGGLRRPEFRDFRDPLPPPGRRDSEFSRRGNQRDQPMGGAQTYEPRKEGLSSRGRGFATRGRGRGEWDARGREREPLGYGDERAVQSRSRSPLRDFRTDREAQKPRETLDIRDDRRLEPRDDRSLDRYTNKERSPFRNESRRASVSSTTVSTSRPQSPALGPPSAAGRPPNELNRTTSALRRPSTHAAVADRWDDRRESLHEPQNARQLQESRVSSPPPPTTVPAFGWNVWTPPTEPKAMKQNAGTTSTSPAAATNAAPPNAPTGPKLAPPTGPKVERVEEGVIPKGPSSKPDTRDAAAQLPRTPASLHSQKFNRSQMPANVTSPPTSPTFVAPTGPRGVSTSGSPQLIGANVPTGPKVDRVQQQPPPWAPTAPASSSRQWQRPNSFSLTGKTGTGVKRDFPGEERRDEPSDNDVYLSERQNGFQGPSETVASAGGDKAGKQPRSPTWGEQTESDNVGGDAGDANDQLNRDAAPHQPSGSLMMDLDEDDFEREEIRFQKEKTRLESEIADLSSLRYTGSDLLRQLAFLSILSLMALPTGNNIAEEPLTNEEGLFGSGPMLTPKAEGLSQNGVAARRQFVETKPAPITATEIQSLPFLNNGPPTPIEELDFYKQNILKHKQIESDLENTIKERFNQTQEAEEARETKYANIYLPWIAMVEQIDRELKEETPLEEELDTSPSVPAPEAATLAPVTSEGRRRGGGVTEYDIERVLQASVETANREEQRRAKQEQSAKFDFEKEAMVKPLKERDIRDRHDFIDETRLISPRSAITCFSLEPPTDVLTGFDHDLLLKHFRDYPKKWGRIAQSIRDEGGSDLTFKECISHYYSTKWSGEYKERRDKRRGRAAKASRMRGGQGRPKANALISNLGGDARADLYDGDDFNGTNVAVTDSGRPRRAAAPTFGEKEAEEPTSLAPTPARRGPKATESTNSNGERLTEKRSRGSTKDRGGRKKRIQPSMRPRSTSPDKSDVATGTASIGAATGELDRSSVVEDNSRIITQQSSVPRTIPAETPAPNRVQGMSLDGTSAPPNIQPARSGPSSYWSVQEVSIFPTYLGFYGTDWHSIAQKMDTKTATMVKNYYFRLISNGERPELEEKVRKADQARQRGETVSTVEPPTASTKKRGAEIHHTPVPRPLAPNAETPEMKIAPTQQYRTSSSSQQILEQKPQKTYSPVAQRPSLHGAPNPNVESGAKTKEQNYVPMHVPEQLTRPSQFGSHPGSPNSVPARPAVEYEAQGRPSSQSNLQHMQNRVHPEVSMSRTQPYPGSNPQQFYQGTPPDRFAQLARDGGVLRVSQGEVKTFEDERPFHSPMDHGLQRLQFGGHRGPMNPHRIPTPPRYGDVRRSQPSSPAPDHARLFPTPSQPPSQIPSQAPTQPPAAPKTEPRKTSNLLSLLNPDNDSRRPNNPPSQNSSMLARTATPPSSQYAPSRPPHPDRNMQFSEAERSTTFPRQSFAQHTSGPPSRPYSESSFKEPSAPVSSFGRQEWQGPPSFPSLAGAPQQGRGSMDRPPVSSALDYPRPSLQALNTRKAPSSPPQSFSFGQPPSHMQHHPHNSSHPGHSSPSTSYHPPSRPSSSLLESNKQSYGRNGGLGMPPPQPSLSQRSGILENFGSRAEPDYRSGRDRESQTRSNPRPDDFLWHGSGGYRQTSGPVKQQQQSQPRQSDAERAQHYGHAKDSRGPPMSPRVTQGYPPGRAPEHPPPGGQGR